MTAEPSRSVPPQGAEPSLPDGIGVSRLTLSRTHRQDVRQRQIYARIDDQSTHTLLFGDAVSAVVPPGTHRLRANNTLFWKSVTFSIEPGEHVEFVLINRAGWFSFGFLALLGAAPLTLVIERR